MEIGKFYSGEGGRTGRAPQDSATVVLLREGTGGPFEFLLMRRRRDQSFMGGAFVFPGGSLEEADSAQDLRECCGGFGGDDARQLLQEPDLSGAKALGLFMAAIRETFEEAGVLLACGASGGTVELTDPEQAARFAVHRVALHDGRLTLAELARHEGIRYAPDRLVAYSHWITPEAEPRRFDTRFFLARVPEGQRPTHDPMELTESRWMTPGEALAEQAAGRIVLMPPTLKTVEELRDFPGIEALLEAARSRKIETILTEAFRSEKGYGVLLPSDPEYSGEALKRPARPGETTRVVMEDGIWRTSSG